MRCLHVIFAEKKLRPLSVVRCVVIVTVPDAVTLMKRFAFIAPVMKRKKVSPRSFSPVSILSRIIF